MNKLISIGAQFPEFNKKAILPGKQFGALSNNFANEEGKWTVMFWWPQDFTLLCPTELVEFNANYNEFVNRNVTLIGASTDSEFVHLAWSQHQEGLGNLQYPMLADTSKSLAEELGILEAHDKVAYRATFIIDPSNTIRWVSVYDIPVGRSVVEVLRVLDALQNGGLCPADWKKGDATIQIPS